MAIDDTRIPVIVGVGQVNDRPENPEDGLDSLGLMEAALRVADKDAGGGWLADIESLATVDQISWPQLGDVLAPLAKAFGATLKHAETTVMAMGDSPVLLLNEAANRIGTGEITVAAIVGGEALRTAAYHAKKAAAAGEDSNTVNRVSAAGAPSYRKRYGLIAPVDVYPLYENAGRAAYGQTLAEGQDETGEIWTRFAEVAKDNPGAWLRNGATHDQIKIPTPNNRRISHPYNKFMVANSSVNQGAGYIVTSLAEAKNRGVPAEQLVYIGYGACAHEAEDPLARDRYDRSTAMIISISKAMEINSLSPNELDYVELYSCFPCVPKMARRLLDWPLDKPATVFGGLTFGGGPIGNYMAHAVVSMVLKLREKGDKGLLFANGGFATHNHTIYLSKDPIEHAAFPQDFNFQQLADDAREPVPSVVEDYAGPATVETFAVLYNRDGSPRFGVVVAKTPDGDRTLAKISANDEAGIAFLTNGQAEPVGSHGTIKATAEGDHIWMR